MAKLVLYVGPRTPRFDTWRSVQTCEEAFTGVLDDTYVDELWVDGYPVSAEGDSLAELLLVEKPWEQGKVGTLVVVVDTASAPETQIERELKGYCPIRREVATPELFG
jgi:hypothetical protein